MSPSSSPSKVLRTSPGGCEGKFIQFNKYLKLIHLSPDYPPWKGILKDTLEFEEEVPVGAGGDRALTPPTRSTATSPRRTSPRGRVSTFQRARQGQQFPPRLVRCSTEVRWKRSNAPVPKSFGRLGTQDNAQDNTQDNDHNTRSLGSPPDEWSEHEYAGRGDEQQHQGSLGPSGGHYMCHHLEWVDEAGKMGEKKGKILFFKFF